MKKHNLVRTVSITVLLFAILSWILVTSSYSAGAGYAETVRNQVGLYELANYFMVALQYFGYIAFFIITVGVFYEVANRTGVTRKLLDSLVSVIKDHESIFIATFMVLMAVVTSFTGLTIVQMFIFPFIIALILLLGYNKITALLVTVGSVMVGIMGTTFGQITISSINEYLSTEETTLNLNTNIWAKVILLVIGLILLIFNTLRYGNRTRNEIDEVDSRLVPKAVKGKKRVAPALVITLITILVFILGILPWDTWKVELWTNVTTSIKEFAININGAEFPLFAKLFGDFQAFGAWQQPVFESALIVIIATIVMAFLYGIKIKDFNECISRGVKKFIGPALLMVAIHMCLVIVVYHPFQLTIVKWIMSMSESFNVFALTLSGFVSSILNVDIMYSAIYTLPFIGGTVLEKHELIAVIWQAAYGLAMLVGPTSVILIGSLAYADVPYLQWLKHVWKLFVELVIAFIIVFLILA